MSLMGRHSGLRTTDVVIESGPLNGQVVIIDKAFQSWGVGRERGGGGKHTIS